MDSTDDGCREGSDLILPTTEEKGCRSGENKGMIGFQILGPILRARGPYPPTVLNHSSPRGAGEGTKNVTERFVGKRQKM